MSCQHRSALRVSASAFAWLLLLSARPVLAVGLLESMDLEIRQGPRALLLAPGINTVGAIDGTTPIVLGPAANGTQVSITIALDQPAVPDEPDRLFTVQINGQAGAQPASLFDPMDDGPISILISNMVYSGVNSTARVAPWHPSEYVPIGLGWLPFFYTLNHLQGFLDLPGAIKYTSPWVSVQVPKSAWTPPYGFVELRNGLRTGMALTGIPDLSGIGPGHAGAPNAIAIISWTPPTFGPPLPQISPGFVDEMSISINMRDVPADPVPLRMVSRRTHAGAGNFDIELPISGPPLSECRACGPQLVIVTFSEPIQAIDGTPDASEVHLSAGNLAGVAIAGADLIIQMTGVPNKTILTMTITGLADLSNTPLAGPVVLRLIALAGDTNEDGKTDLTDMAQTKARNGLPLVGKNIRSDVNTDGKVDLTDMALVKSLFLSGGLP